MSIPTPNLDNRTFEELFEACKRRIPVLCPEWTDLGESDPGIVLLQLFSFLTETMLYQLNRLPEKAYIEFLNLLGVTLQPPQSAIATLRFSVETAPAKDIEIPRGTRAAVGRSASGSEQVIFVTDQTVKIVAGKTEADVTAHHCEEVNGELIGRGTGEPGLFLRVARPPIIAPTRDGLDLTVGVETKPDEHEERESSVLYAGKRFRIWREVDSFANLTGDTSVYVLDRTNGTIQFAPSARMTDPDGKFSPSARPLASVPQPDREIRAWYRRGGGAIGNAAAGTIDTLKDPIPQVRVINPAEATGGRDSETMENALTRGPQELRTRDRAVTADDFETMALQRSGGVVRAKALARAEQWRYAPPGEVEVVLVPAVSDSDKPGFRLSLDRLLSAQSEALRGEIETLLRQRVPLGVRCVVNWARYKRVSVLARIVVFKQEDTVAVRSRLVDRISNAFSPLPNAVRNRGWSFGETLRAFHVHDCAVAEPGVKFVDRVRFRVDEAPNKDVRILLPDPFQPNTWYAGSGDILYRTLNNGEGWEPAGRFSKQVVETASAHPSRAGFLAAVTRIPDETGCHIWISPDCGETWSEKAHLDAVVRWLSWIEREDQPLLLMASDAGLYQLSLEPGKGPALIDVTAKSDAAVLAVASGVNAEGQTCVAVVLDQRGGVLLSRDAAKAGSFRAIGLDQIDVRTLQVQSEGSRLFLWAATFSSGGDEGAGCFRWELTRSEDPPDKWISFTKDWKGGSCFGLAFSQGQAYAATHHGGVMRLDARSTGASWRPVPLNSGLPLNRDTENQKREGLARVSTVGADPASARVLAAGPQGVYRSEDKGESYHPTSNVENDQVTLPTAWLFCPAEPELEVVREDEIE